MAIAYSVIGLFFFTYVLTATLTDEKRLQPYERDSFFSVVTISIACGILWFIPAIGYLMKLKIR